MKRCFRDDHCVRAQRCGWNMVIVLDELDEALTNSSKVAAALGDEFPVYLIDMAVLHVRKKAVPPEDRDERQVRKASFTNNAESRTARSGVGGAAAL